MGLETMTQALETLYAEDPALALEAAEYVSDIEARIVARRIVATLSREVLV